MEPSFKRGLAQHELWSYARLGRRVYGVSVQGCGWSLSDGVTLICPVGRLARACFRLNLRARQIRLAAALPGREGANSCPGA